MRGLARNLCVTPASSGSTRSSLRRRRVLSGTAICGPASSGNSYYTARPRCMLPSSVSPASSIFLLILAMAAKSFSSISARVGLSSWTVPSETPASVSVWVALASSFFLESFSDMAGSTLLGEKLDPESVHRMMGRFFQAMKSVIERHGGSVEKFIGDAVMGAFGVPRLHEDDALRAVRAAHEMRDVLGSLNREFE